MKLFIKSLFLCGLSIIGCTPNGEQTPKSSTRGSGGDSISPVYPWESESNSINLLEAENANLEKWKASSSNSVRVSSNTQLVDISTRLDKESREEALRHFATYPQTYHFSYETGYQALVFFSEGGIPQKIIKW